jgi:hypothetical protein
MKCVTGMVKQEYVTRFAMQAAETTNALAIFGGLHDKAEVDRNTLIALSILADRSGRLVGFVELGLEADTVGQSSISVAIGKLGTAPQ